MYRQCMTTVALFLASVADGQSGCTHFATLPVGNDIKCPLFQSSEAHCYAATGAIKKKHKTITALIFFPLCSKDVG